MFPERGKYALRLGPVIVSSSCENNSPILVVSRGNTRLIIKKACKDEEQLSGTNTQVSAPKKSNRRSRRKNAVQSKT